MIKRLKSKIYPHLVCVGPSHSFEVIGGGNRHGLWTRSKCKLCGVQRYGYTCASFSEEIWTTETGKEIYKKEKNQND